MFKIVTNRILGILFCVTLIWVAYTESTRYMQLAEINDAQQCIEREMKQVEAVKVAQERAEPLIRLAEQLAHENAMFNSILEKARQTVKMQADELEQTKEALNHAIDLLKEQIEENNRCVDYIRKLEDFINVLLEKIPANSQPQRPTFID